MTTIKNLDMLMSRSFYFQDIMSNITNTTTNHSNSQSAVDKFLNLDHQTVSKCFYLWLIRQNNNDYIGLSKNTDLYKNNPTFQIDDRCYILFEWDKLLVSFDTNMERSPLVDEYLQVKIYCCGNRELIDKSYLRNLNAFVTEYSGYKFRELSRYFCSIEFEIQDCAEIFQEYHHNVDQHLPTFYQTVYQMADNVGMDLREEYIIHNDAQNYLIKTMKLDYERKNPFRAKRNSVTTYPKYCIDFEIKSIHGILVKEKGQKYHSIPFCREAVYIRDCNFYLTMSKAVEAAQKTVEKDTEEMRKEYDCFINEYEDFLNTLEQNLNTILASFRERSLTIYGKQKRELENSYLANQDSEVI